MAERTVNKATVFILHLHKTRDLCLKKEAEGKLQVGLAEWHGKRLARHGGLKRLARNRYASAKGQDWEGQGWVS